MGQSRSFSVNLGDEALILFAATSETSGQGCPIVSPACRSFVEQNVLSPNGANDPSGSLKVFEFRPQQLCDVIIAAALTRTSLIAQCGFEAECS